MFLRWRRWRCCYAENDVTLRMLLRWRCFYVEDVKHVAMLKKGCAFRPLLLVIMAFFMGFMTTLKFYQHAILPVSTKTTQIISLKNPKLVKTADNIPQLCCPACWRRSMRYRVPWRPQNAVKRSEKRHFQFFFPAPFQLRLGELQASFLFLYTHAYAYAYA